ncbi:hypothetical protein J3E68DRAFT_446850 [Trichoderma sp. SZMC 28012]
MDPLSALAIAAAVFQFLELGGKLCIKGWEKYKQIQQAIPDDQKLAEEEEELRKIFEELSGQISWFRQVSTSIVVSQPPTPTQVQLLKLSSQCASISSDFEQIKSQLKLHNPQKMESDQRNKDIERMTGKLGPLKREIMDFILLSLWDDSKRTKQWELHFSNQLDKLIELLASPEKTPSGKPHISVLLNPQTTAEVENSEDLMQQSGMAISITADEETARLRNALLPLIQPGTGLISLKQLANDMIDYLQVDARAMNIIRGELVNILWANDWKLHPFMAFAKIDTAMVARAIATGVQFINIQTREEAISKTFKETYSWIFLDEPPTKNGIPIWNSFSKWLEDDTKNVYWVTGKPGSGKSTIMKLILQSSTLEDRLSRSFGSLRLLIVRYYAWISGNKLQKSIEGLQRTILFQALQQFPDLAPVLTPRRWALCQALRSTSDLPTWDKRELEESFEALLSSCGETIKLALFVDGLDEFEMPPFEVIKCIQHMRTRCPYGLKVCAASRPWPEFQDEFNEGPMLQMHLLTENDTKIFVNKSFTVNKGFVEQRELHPEAASQLLTDIVQRANGVFLWVSIVVQHLSSRFSEGQSIFQAREILKALPTGISSLYDFMWADIDPNNLPDASCMIQVLRAFDGPVPWMMLWLIEESRFTTIDKIVLPKTENRKAAAHRSLKRKLAACTKCILEINEGGESPHVDFIHRTARDWAVQSNMWELICSKSSGKFDPYLEILRGKTIGLLQDLPETRNTSELIREILQYASQVKDIPENTSKLVDYLDLVNERFESLVKLYKDTDDITGKDLDYCGIESFIPNYGENFLEASAHFAILPYIRAVACSQPSYVSQMLSGGSFRLLEKVIYNYGVQDTYDQRLATVKYLLELEQGVVQNI